MFPYPFPILQLFNSINGSARKTSSQGWKNDFPHHNMILCIMPTNSSYISWQGSSQKWQLGIEKDLHSMTSNYQSNWPKGKGIPDDALVPPIAYGRHFLQLCESYEDWSLFIYVIIYRKIITKNYIYYEIYQQIKM